MTHCYVVPALVGTEAKNFQDPRMLRSVPYVCVKIRDVPPGVPCGTLVENTLLVRLNQTFHRIVVTKSGSDYSFQLHLGHV